MYDLLPQDLTFWTWLQHDNSLTGKVLTFPCHLKEKAKDKREQGVFKSLSGVIRLESFLQ